MDAGLGIRLQGGSSPLVLFFLIAVISDLQGGRYCTSFKVFVRHLYARRGLRSRTAKGRSVVLGIWDAKFGDHGVGKRIDAFGESGN